MFVIETGSLVNFLNMKLMSGPNFWAVAQSDLKNYLRKLITRDAREKRIINK